MFLTNYLMLFDSILSRLSASSSAWRYLPILVRQLHLNRKGIGLPSGFTSAARFR